MAPTEKDEVEESVNITSSLPKPRVEEEKGSLRAKEKAAVKAAADAAEEAAENDPGAVGTAAVPAAVVDGKLRDLEVLSTGSDPQISKISEGSRQREDSRCSRRCKAMSIGGGNGDSGGSGGSRGERSSSSSRAKCSSSSSKEGSSSRR